MVGHAAKSFKRHVWFYDRPFVVRLKHQRANEADAFGGQSLHYLSENPYFSRPATDQRDARARHGLNVGFLPRCMICSPRLPRWALRPFRPKGDHGPKLPAATLGLDFFQPRSRRIGECPLWRALVWTIGSHRWSIHMRRTRRCLTGKQGRA